MESESKNKDCTFKYKCKNLQQPSEVSMHNTVTPRWQYGDYRNYLQVATNQHLELVTRSFME